MNHTVSQVKIGERDYPELLKYISDPPEVLYYMGDISIASQPSIAVVGARKATSYGKWAAYGFAKKLSEYGIGVVSGMAYGIDSFAHKGQGTLPLPFRFPLRNRIISGLSLGTIIVEAGINSGSLITAERAAEQGRNIYALPGNINNMYSFGANKLIQDGATPLIAFDDIIDELGIARSSVLNSAAIEFGKDEREIYEFVLQTGETTTDSICRSVGKLPSEVNAVVTILEMKGLLHTALGKIFIAN